MLPALLTKRNSNAFLLIVGPHYSWDCWALGPKDLTSMTQRLTDTHPTKNVPLQFFTLGHKEIQFAQRIMLGISDNGQLH